LKFLRGEKSEKKVVDIIRCFKPLFKTTPLGPVVHNPNVSNLHTRVLKHLIMSTTKL
jgi:hypothetical protein